jgi:DNA-binding CsgD family transcriptional regulator
MTYYLSRNDLEDILKLVNFCMTHVKMGNVDPKNLLIEMIKIFRSYDAEFFPSNQSLDGVDLINSLSIKESPAEQVKYKEYYWRYDPLYAAQFCPTPTNRVFKTDDIISYSHLRKLDYYQEYLRRINWFGELVIRLCTDSGFWGAISLSRTPKQPYFNNSDVQKAEFLLPYLINTFETMMVFSKMSREREAFEQWLESRPDGVILLDAKLCSIFHNDKARQFSQSLSGIGAELISKHNIDGITLPETMVEDCKYLVHMFKSQGFFSHNRIINTKYGERYYVKYTVVGYGSTETSLPYLIIIHINNLTVHDETAGMTLIKDYKLSMREEIIARYTGLGLTNKEIAAKLGISSFTVQSHLRNIFSKMGVERRAQLANLIN